MKAKLLGLLTAAALLHACGGGGSPGPSTSSGSTTSVDRALNASQAISGAIVAIF